ncbi:hypothetical protein OAN22_00325 [Alphaproteobacteria bacterium]|nr:hypothetical protein [Alphaproteobacteria bacterium]
MPLKQVNPIFLWSRWTLLRRQISVNDVGVRQVTLVPSKEVWGSKINTNISGKINRETVKSNFLLGQKKSSEAYFVFRSSVQMNDIWALQQSNQIYLMTRSSKKAPRGYQMFLGFLIDEMELQRSGLSS